MTQERLTVRKIQKVLRLKWGSKLSNRVVGRACNISCSTVSEYVQRASRAGLRWPLPEELSDEPCIRSCFLQQLDWAKLRKRYQIGSRSIAK
jgi:hypothetical protein